MSNRCPICGKRRARRACPALGQQICTVCCGTKRQVEINCPVDCGYLTSAKTHPPATVQRQKKRDLAFLLPMLEGLSERQHQFLLLVQAFLRGTRPGTASVVDTDVSLAARALAETFETASRGIIYEHGANVLSAENLTHDLRDFLKNKQREGLHITDAEAAAVMRRIEQAATDASNSLPGDENAYLELLKRVLRDPKTDPSKSSFEQVDPNPSRVIIPGR